ncbi:unnamed protein product [Prorocentrum cordatum]|uniref:Uncharacterized protein n=1 Tax=Prorocentrum cordatum TaxID=2364126 RepID=A0ABN9T9N4_9DINO|nr:unnamed protein product [Polarella glacialis]
MGGGAPSLVRLALLDGAAWARDAIVTLVGHTAGATRALASARRPRVGPPQLADPEVHDGHDAYRRAVAQATWSAHKAVIRKYAQLRRDAPNQAERYIAKFFSAQQAFEIAHAQPTTGEPLECPGMAAAAEADLRARVDNDFPRDPAEQDAQRKVVSTIRAAGAGEPAPKAGSADREGVQDALRLSRNAGKLEAYAGAARQGGVGDPLSLALALAIHAQLRASQNMPTWWALTDLRWAFDVASRPAMLLAALAAGIPGADWLILDDTFTQDRLCVSLPGCLGAAFLLGAGTVPGRRFSAHVFNGQLRGLADEVENVLPRGCSSFIPAPHRRMLAGFEATCPAPTSDPAAPAPPASSGKLLGLAGEIVHKAAAEEPPGPPAQVRARCALTACASQADRVAIVNAFGTVPLPPAQYSGDLAVACPSPGALRAVVSDEPMSARSLYARRTRAQFNYATGNTAVMALCESPDPGSVGADEAPRPAEPRCEGAEAEAAGCGWLGPARGRPRREGGGALAGGGGGRRGGAGLGRPPAGGADGAPTAGWPPLAGPLRERTNSRVHVPSLLAAAGLLDQQEAAGWSTHPLTHDWWQPTVEALQQADPVPAETFAQGLEFAGASPGAIYAVIAAGGGARPGHVHLPPAVRALADSAGYIDNLAQDLLLELFGGVVLARGVDRRADELRDPARREAGQQRIPKEQLLERFTRFEAGDWAQLLTEAQPGPPRRPPERDANGQSRAPEARRGRAPDENEELRSRCERARELIRLGEVSAARQALTASAVAPGTQATLDELRDPARRLQQPREQLSERAARAPPQGLASLEPDRLLTNVRRSRRGAAPGPSGMTGEHLQTLLDDEHCCDLLHHAATLLARAEIPGPVAEALRLGRLTALRKSNGRARGIVTGDVFRIPHVGDLQSSWLLLSMCANPRANFFLRALAPEDTAAFAAAHDDNLANALADLLELPQEAVAEGTSARQRCQLPLCMGGLGLRSASRTAPAAWWASWADCAQMLRERCPELTNQICAAQSELDRGPLPAAPGCLQQASRAKEHLSAHGFAAPNWHDLAQEL